MIAVARFMAMLAALMLIVPPIVTTSVPPCEFEDGSGQAVCYWDAATSGNGRGESYLMVGGERL